MLRSRLYDIRLSSLPGDIGECVGNIAAIAQSVNAAQRRLLFAKEAGDEGWWGTFAEVVWNVPRMAPFITLPREIARVQGVAVCGRPIAMQNAFFEYLQFGNGRLPHLSNNCAGHRPMQIVSRNNVCTFADLTNAPQYIAVYPTDPADAQAARRVLIQGHDQNDAAIYTLDGSNQVLGQFLTLEVPFTKTTMLINRLTGIQKDVTIGPVQFFQLDPNTGAQTLLLTMEPSETTAWYRRYYLDALPRDCCYGASTSATPTVQVAAICKLELIPVAVDTDYLLIGNIEAIIEEAQANRYGKMDDPNAATLEAKCHAKAIGHLKSELIHYLGKDDPAINFKPFGSASLERLRVAMQ
jgi:hypothetical protein